MSQGSQSSDIPSNMNSELHHAAPAILSDGTVSSPQVSSSSGASSPPRRGASAPPLPPPSSTQQPPPPPPPLSTQPHPRAHSARTGASSSRNADAALERLMAENDRERERERERGRPQRRPERHAIGTPPRSPRAEAVDDRYRQAVADARAFRGTPVSLVPLRIMSSNSKGKYRNCNAVCVPLRPRRGRMKG